MMMQDDINSFHRHIYFSLLGSCVLGFVCVFWGFFWGGQVSYLFLFVTFVPVCYLCYYFLVTVKHFILKSFALVPCNRMTKDTSRQPLGKK